MVGCNAQGNVLLCVGFIFNAGDIADMLHDIFYGINLKEVVNPLHYAGKTLKTHTGVDIFLFKLGIIAVAVVVKLGKYVVPNFHKTVAVAARLAIRRAAAVFFAAVKVNFGARTAGTGAVFPEVIGFTEANDTLCGNTYLLVPNFKSFLIVLIDRGPKKLTGNFKPFGKELPRPRNSLVLEIIAEREVSKHLEISTVSGGLANIFNIAGTHTLLAGANTLAGRLLLTGKEGLHGSHTGIDQQQRCIVLRNQRKSGQTQMIFALKICQKAFTQFIQSKFFHIEHLSIFVSVILLISGFS